MKAGIAKKFVIFEEENIIKGNKEAKIGNSHKEKKGFFLSFKHFTILKEE